MIGKSFSNYSIVDKIGEGGMGEVYRAQDSKLKRDVAIKVLPSHLLEDPERLGRFEREAQLLASLNHPNIAAVYGLEESEGHQCLIMELVEGEDLAIALQRGPLTPENVIPIAKQVADALEAAHESGVIHRDLKPANILMRPDGQIKVLDFGLAKAIEGDPSESNPALTQSPTLTGMMTGANVILGTAAYMSPEQARGQRVDKRTDIWAYGVVLFQLLTGKQTFEGDTVSDILASVLKSEPDWSTLPDTTPRALRHLIERCLTKNPKQRLRDIGEARILLEAGESDETPEPQVVSAPAARGIPKLLVPALLVLTVLAAALAWTLKPTPPQQTIQGAILLPPAEQLMPASGGHLAFSPDGTRLAFATADSLGKRSLWVRNLADGESHRISGTDGAINPFWSPDGSQIGFFNETHLRRVPVVGGAPISLCEAGSGRGGAWHEDGTIVFSPRFNSGLQTIDALGGTPEDRTTLKEGEFSHRWPQFLDHGLLYLGLGNPDGVFYQAEGDTAKLLIPGFTQAEYRDGLLYYMNEDVLFARPFDEASATFTGDPRTVLTGLHVSSNFGRAVYSVSRGGRVAYLPTASDVSTSRLAHYSRAGDVLDSFTHLGAISDPALSPQGDQIAYSKFDVEANEFDLWVFEINRGVTTRMTFNGQADDPVWSPDGTLLAHADSSNICIIPASGVGSQQFVTNSKAVDDCTHDWSRDGRYLMWSRTGEGDISLWIHDLESGETRRLIDDALQGQFSPDGKWIVYQSQRSGTRQIYLQDFPALTGRRQVSTEGGEAPRWSADGTRIYYLADDVTLMETPIQFENGKPYIERPTRLFTSHVDPDRSIVYSVAGDDTFWMIENPDQITGGQPIRFVLNWQGNE